MTSSDVMLQAAEDLDVVKQRVTYLERRFQTSDDLRRHLRTLLETFMPDALADDVARRRWLYRSYRKDVLGPLTEMCARDGSALTRDVSILSALPQEVALQILRDAGSYLTHELTEVKELTPDIVTKATSHLKPLVTMVANLKFMTQGPEAAVHGLDEVTFELHGLDQKYDGLLKEVTCMYTTVLQLKERADELLEFDDATMATVKKMTEVAAGTVSDEYVRDLVIHFATMKNMTSSQTNGGDVVTMDTQVF